MPESATETEPRIQGFIAMVYHYWGWGATQEEAIAKLDKAARERTKKSERLIYALPEGAINAWVDDLGQIRWEWAEDAPHRDVVGITIAAPTS